MTGPTMELRWRVPPGTSTQPPILQQKWRVRNPESRYPGDGHHTTTEEWRDVPFVAAAAKP